MTKWVRAVDWEVWEDDTLLGTVTEQSMECYTATLEPAQHVDVPGEFTTRRAAVRAVHSLARKLGKGG